MSLKDIQLKVNYSSDKDNILSDFYIPSLSESINYYRLSGYFSSVCLAAAAKGIAKFIKNDGTMKLICGACLRKEDIEAISNNEEDFNKVIENALLREMDFFEEIFIEEHVKAMSWMIARQKLQIKIAVVFDQFSNPLDIDKANRLGIFHQKVGILEDVNGNRISFSGSINETGQGWLKNIEEFKVFRSWIENENEYLITDYSKFDNYWNNLQENFKVIEIPDAIKNNLIQMAPNEIDYLKLDNIERKLFKNKKILPLREYQKEAIQSWINNDKRGLFEMATGTGKTITALGCLDVVLKEEKRLIVVITCPQMHLIQQWEREINKFNIEFDKLFISSSINYNWKDSLSNLLNDYYLGYENKIVIITTHDTFASKDFNTIIEEKVSNGNIFLIADEVHGLGSKMRQNSLKEGYRYRLGLSATPKRWFDDLGTLAIYNYFDKVVYEFPLSKAINEINPDTGETFLTPYRYIPMFSLLDDEELYDYLNITKKIIAWSSKSIKDEESQLKLENLYFLRANIIKDAKNKYNLLKEILIELKKPINWTIIYCSPSQINEVMSIISDYGIVAHKFTMDEGTKPEERCEGLSERDFLIKKFAETKYQVLVAMKCLDEGVDIPPARTAIIMASSSNPREYIQRIGRIIRRYPDKIEATIYDLIVAPSSNSIPEEFKDIEYKIFQKELIRFKEIAHIALNSVSAMSMINKFYNFNLSKEE